MPVEFPLLSGGFIQKTSQGEQGRMVGQVNLKKKPVSVRNYRTSGLTIPAFTQVYSLVWKSPNVRAA